MIKNIITYVKIRPVLAWSSLCLVLSISSMIAIQCGTGRNNPFIDTDEFEMVELQLPPATTEPDITIDNTVRQTPENRIEPLFFGDDSGDYKEITEKSIQPRPLFRRLPQYPSSMRNAGIEGKVIIEVGISESGAILYGRIIQSLHPTFDLAVIEWAKQIRFTPAMDIDRNPFRCRVRMPIRFRLDL